MTEPYKIILFDGVCNLCNRFVNFIIDRDKKNSFKFAALQSSTGEKLLISSGFNPDSLYSIILIDIDKYYEKSSAVLRIIKYLGGFWQIFFSLIIIPPFLRNPVYNLIARKRYKWFGKRDVCKIPSPEMNQKFLI